MFANNMRKENVKVLQIERWDVVFNVDVMEWQNGFAGTQSSSLNLFSEILRVIGRTIKLIFNTNTKWVL